MKDNLSKRQRAKLKREAGAARAAAGKRAKLRAGEVEERVDSIETQAEDGEEWFLRAMGGGRSTRNVPATKVIPDDGSDIGGDDMLGSSVDSVKTGKRQRSMKKKKRRKKDDDNQQTA